MHTGKTRFLSSLFAKTKQPVLRSTCATVQTSYIHFIFSRGWSGGAMVLGELPVPGRPTVWIRVGQGPTALAVGAGGCCLDMFTLIYPFSPLSPSLWETARYRLKYCLKGPLNPKQPTNQHIFHWTCSLCRQERRRSDYVYEQASLSHSHRTFPKVLFHSLPHDATLC